MPVMEIQGKTLHTVDVRWDEVYYTNCPLVSASNIDQELGWVREELKKIASVCPTFPPRPDNDWYPHYIHNLDNLVRVGGCFPPIHVNADLRRTVLLGTTWVRGRCMAVRSGDAFFRMKDLRARGSASARASTRSRMTGGGSGAQGIEGCCCSTG